MFEFTLTFEGNVTLPNATSIALHESRRALALSLGLIRRLLWGGFGLEIVLQIVCTQGWVLVEVNS